MGSRIAETQHTSAAESAAPTYVPAEPQGQPFVRGFPGVTDALPVLQLKQLKQLKDPQEHWKDQGWIQISPQTLAKSGWDVDMEDR